MSATVYESSDRWRAVRRLCELAHDPGIEAYGVKLEDWDQTAQPSVLYHLEHPEEERWLVLMEVQRV